MLDTNNDNCNTHSRTLVQENTHSTMYDKAKVNDK